MVVSRALGAIGLALMAGLLAGCWTSGTPDSGQARIVNDTKLPVLVWFCTADDCGKPSFVRRVLEGRFRDQFELGPGKTAGPFNISRIGVPTVALVLRPNPPGREDAPVNPEKQRLGCLPIVMPRYVEDGLSARVSQAVRCQRSYDEDAQWPAAAEQP